MGNKGNRNFNRCKAKAIELKNYYQAIGSRSNIWESEPPKGKDYDMNFAAALECPKTRLQKIGISTHVHGSKSDALRELAPIAAEAACATCTFSRMSPAAAEKTEAEILSARALRITAENELKKAEREKRRLEKLGEAEVNAINERHGVYN